MSRHHERKEKNCLNCGTMVHGRFCHVCGQENIEPKESFWGMVVHFFNDITHFDGKFFVTLKDLVWRPGFLPAEYIRGRRASYLHPVRMYVFTSAIFFLVFFTASDPKHAIRSSTPDQPYSQDKRSSIMKMVGEKLKREPGNRDLQAQYDILSDTTKPVTYAELLPYSGDFNLLGTFNGKYTSQAEYDSVQQSLPSAYRDGWLKRIWNKKAVEFNEKYRYQRALSLEKLSEGIIQKLPYLLFLSLPFIALLLQLLYGRHKNYYYTDHGIFALYQYIFSFILMLFVILLDQLYDITGWKIWNILININTVIWAIYLYISMKRFYKQGWLKTFFKFFLLNFAGLILLLVLFVLFTLFAVFSI